jgi:hypothetical protein
VVARRPPRLRLRAAAHAERVHLSAVRRPGAASPGARDGDHRDRPPDRGLGRAARPDHVVARHSGRRSARVAPVGRARHRDAGGARVGAGSRDARLGADRPGDRRPRTGRRRRAASRPPVGRRGNRPGDGDQGDTGVVAPLPRGHPAVARGSGSGRNLRRHGAGRLGGRPVGPVLDPNAVADRPGGAARRSERSVPTGAAGPTGRPPRAEFRTLARPGRPCDGHRDHPGGASAPAWGRARRRHGHRIDRLPDQPDLLGAPPVLGRARGRRARRRRGGDAGRGRVAEATAPGRPRRCRGRCSRRRRSVRKLADLVLRGGARWLLDDHRRERVRAARAGTGGRPAGQGSDRSAACRRAAVLSRPSGCRGHARTAFSQRCGSETPWRPFC